jgi:hypothetical protein
MRTFYVIKNLTSLQYISIEDKWDDWNMSKEFETKQDAIDYGIETNLGMCVIEEVINFI